jgi:rubrerythrin
MRGIFMDLKLIEEAYGFKVKDIQSIKNVFRIETDCGVKCVKRAHMSPSFFLFIYSAVKYLMNRGYDGVIPYNTTQDGSICIPDDTHVYYVVDWIEARECKFKREDELRMAIKAAAEGFPQVARLFRAIAEAETVHAHAHLRALGAVKGTVENLQAAIDGEEYEFKDMYPGFVAEAEKDGGRAAALSFRFALAVEEFHHGLYSEALKNVQNGSDLPEAPVYVCDVCGHTVVGAAPGKCPVCGAAASRWTSRAGRWSASLASWSARAPSPACPWVSGAIRTARRTVPPISTGRPASGPTATGPRSPSVAAW